MKTLTGGVRALMKGNKVTTFAGLGTITAPGQVRVQSSLTTANRSRLRPITL